MCHYCGCRDLPLIRDYVAEHEQALDCADDILRALDRCDRDTVAHLLKQMQALLSPHWRGEEDGIFQVMAPREEQYADYVTPLVAEHRELAQLLASVDVSTARANARCGWPSTNFGVTSGGRRTACSRPA